MHVKAGDWILTGGADEGWRWPTNRVCSGCHETSLCFTPGL